MLSYSIGFSRLILLLTILQQFLLKTPPPSFSPNLLLYKYSGHYSVLKKLPLGMLLIILQLIGSKLTIKLTCCFFSSYQESFMLNVVCFEFQFFSFENTFTRFILIRIVYFHQILHHFRTHLQAIHTNWLCFSNASVYADISPPIELVLIYANSASFFAVTISNSKLYCCWRILFCFIT
ncbi:hypothetical protein BpHYR1_024725 [Brachionus plicatilis]|uniref:Uncharacterized protein n=1 Tax=Brachionus plicatilis TaxID=10195 RepID=A0A3M7QKD1_BRAPC|nr:hypothetical protein BpHYR1_024725 [Brachionus plicatilis]